MRQEENYFKCVCWLKGWLIIAHAFKSYFDFIGHKFQSSNFLCTLISSTLYSLCLYIFQISWAPIDKCPCTPLFLLKIHGPTTFRSINNWHSVAKRSPKVIGSSNMQRRQQGTNSCTELSSCRLFLQQTLGNKSLEISCFFAFQIQEKEQRSSGGCACYDDRIKKKSTKRQQKAQWKDKLWGRVVWLYFQGKIMQRRELHNVCTDPEFSPWNREKKITIKPKHNINYIYW